MTLGNAELYRLKSDARRGLLENDLIPEKTFISGKIIDLEMSNSNEDLTKKLLFDWSFITIILIVLGKGF